MHSRPTPSRRRDCHFADIPSQSLLNAYQRKRGVQQNDSLADGYPRQPRGPEVPNRCRRPGRWLKYEWQNMNGRNRREQEGTDGQKGRGRRTGRRALVLADCFRAAAGWGCAPDQPVSHTVARPRCDGGRYSRNIEKSTARLPPSLAQQPALK